MTQTDVIETFGSSTVHHGEINQRIYLMKLLRADYPGIIPRLEDLAAEHGYTKIFVKVPVWARDGFLEAGYTQEATVPGFYNGQTDALFFGKYRDDARAALSPEEKATLDDVLAVSRAKAPKSPAAADAAAPALPDGFTARICQATDADDIVDLYKTVFETYPFPIHDPNYILETMLADVVYFGVWQGERLVAVSSSEMDVAAQNAEMTDFATLPEMRGRGLALYLLAAMHREMRRRNILTAYTIARALHHGMNIPFAKMGYAFGGTLIHNTNIAGQIESMNVWHRPLE